VTLAWLAICVSFPEVGSAVSPRSVGGNITRMG
jgi:hypothetical protein